MNTFYDVQQLLKGFVIIIYLGVRLADLDLMEWELKELYQSNMVDIMDYQKARLIVRHEIQKEKDKRK
jgi:uncharacterized protein YqgQ